MGAMVLYFLFGMLQAACTNEVSCGVFVLSFQAKLPNMALPNMALPNKVLPNMVLPNMALPNMALPNMATRCERGGRVSPGGASSYGRRRGPAS